MSDAGCQETQTQPAAWRHRARDAATAAPASFLADLQDGQERFLGNLHAADRFHSLLACLLLLEKLAFPRNVATVALGEHVFAQCLDALASDDLRADRRLDRNVEHLPRNQRAHLRHDLATAIL